MIYHMDEETHELIVAAKREFPDEKWGFWPDDWESEAVFREDLKHRLNELRKKQDEKQ